MINLSVVIITLNEQENLKRCLSSLPKGCEIVVVDSGSVDRTVDVAKSFGAKVYERPFDDFATQKNFGIEKAKRGWVFSIDADEHLDDTLRSELQKIDFDSLPKSVYKIRRRLVFNHQIMKFGKTSDNPIRLFPSSSRFKNAIHEVIDYSDTSLKKIPGTIIHHSYKNHEDYFKRFNSYTTKIAYNHYSNKKTPPPVLLHCLRPFFEFISRFFLRLGFMDGANGFTYALYSSLYAYVKYEKLIEIQNFGLAQGEQSND